MSAPVRVGSLCTGYGGIEMGLRLAGVDVDTRWVSETEPSLAPVLGDIPNHGDITRANWSTVEPVDILTAGFPCQPVSAAGRQLGEDDPRWLWPAVRAAVAELQPTHVAIENVRNLISIHGGRLWAGILADLESLGYGVRWLTLGACHVGAAHHRHRVFAVATMGASGVERVEMPFCGVGRKGVQLLPTPSASTYGSNQGGAMGRVGPVRYSLAELARRGDLLPTPASRDGQGRGMPSKTTAEARYAAGRRNLDDGLALLPTPTAREGDSHGRGEGGEYYWRKRRESGRTNGMPLGAAVTLLPTPRGTDGVNGGPNQRGRCGDLALPSAVQPERWGRFAAAIARHESLYGQAPTPTEPNRNGAPRLAPAFAEWLMCLPAGHVTAKLGRRDALRAIGNGVCPPQFAAAWQLLTAEDAR